MRLLLLCLLCAAGTVIQAQDKISFQGISFPLGGSWSETGEVSVHPESGKVNTMDGSGVLLNMPGKRNKGADLYSQEEYGNFDLSFYYMMFPGSNSGVYLHGNYEVQLRDSWGVKVPSSADNGGVYERWTDQETGYGGRAPRQNASRAPGLWQHMVISFTAPVFDESGTKTDNARLSVTLNGVEIHSDIELTGPTRGAMGEERARGPIRIQGDHGPVAFRDMRLIPFDSPKPVLKDVSYTSFKGKFIDEPDYATLPPEATGEIPLMTPEVSPSQNDFLIRYTGTLAVKTEGTYKFEANFPGGSGALIVNGSPVIPFTGWNGEGSLTLPAGEVPFEVRYAKVYEWVTPGLSVRVEGPGFRMTELADATVNVSSMVDPIYLEAPEVLRSFMDIPEEGRVVRAVSVGTRENVHYTYDMDNGSVVHAWRGAFLNTTPMWHDRGDGSSVPRGTICYLDGTSPPVQPLSGQWKEDTTGLRFHINGYRILDEGKMSFSYSIGTYTIDDQLQPLPSGKGIRRTVSSSTNSPLYVRVGHGEKVSEVDKGLYRILGRGNYFVRLDNSVNAEIRLTADGEMELVAPLGTSLTYSILF